MHFFIKLLQNKHIIREKKNKFFFFVLFNIVGVISTAHAAELVAITTKPIQGNEPYLLQDDGVTKIKNSNELVGFHMWDGTYSADGKKHQVHVDASQSNKSIAAPRGMTYQDVTALVTTDGNLNPITHAIVGSDEGNAVNLANTNITGKIKATWYNGGVKVSAAELSKPLTICGGPYTLKIEAPTQVIANTTYGYPNSKTYDAHSEVTYTFTSTNPGICYVAPNDMTVFTSGQGYTLKYSDGYNPDKWVANVGFKADAGFPTTGFYKASFNLIGSGNDQSRYRCSSTDDGGKIVLSGTASSSLGAKCNITYEAKTKAQFILGGTPKVTMEYNDGKSWANIGTYSIPEPKKWAVGAGKMQYANSAALASATAFPALDACRLIVDGTNTPATTTEQGGDKTDTANAWRKKYIYARNELSNSPATETPATSGSINSNGRYSRDVDGTFMAEWGSVYNYAGSDWSQAPTSWTAEPWMSIQFTIGLYGNVGYNYPTTSSIGAICRGE